jgi:hypothetical protein
MLERSGFGEEIAAFDAGIAAGDVERAQRCLSERMLDSIAGIGDADAVGGAVSRYREAGALSPCVGGIPGTDFEATLEAAAEAI